MKILLVDDDQSILAIISTAFQNEGFETSTAMTGKLGIEKAKLEKPHFILLDQVLPDIQGNEVLSNLKQDVDTKDIPVAILSNYNDTQLMQDALNRGAMDYILKYQVEPQDLIQKVKGLLHESQTNLTNI